ncbi:hypothetical protein TrST_g7240 [Triparma strigata]|uniref:subtilisin n=1 Tax=Triparma strigata TaxID=1606541 RepID=A0A9W7BLB5_9STRA|nr:hypothetical protein TrST_g7240 [Triparma strigata]
MILNSILALSLVLTTVSGQSNFRKGSPSLHEDIPLYHSSDRHAILQQQGKTFVEDIDEAIAHADNLERRRLQDGADEGSPAEYPFVVCHQDPNILGGERRQEIESHFSIPSAYPSTSSHESYLQTLYNSDSATCYITSSLLSHASSAPPNLSVHPVTPSMKFPSGFTSSLDSGKYDDIDAIRLHLCPLSSPTAPTLITQSLLNLDMTEKCSLSILELSSTLSPHDPLTMWISNLSPLLDSGCLLPLLNQISISPLVCALELQTRPKLHNKEAAWITQSAECKTESNVDCKNSYNVPRNGDRINEAKSTPFWKNGITGEGQIVQVSDSGLDVDNQYFWDSDCVVPKDTSGSSNLNCRKVVQYVAYVDGTDDENGHGTHVVGSVLGHRSTTGSDATSTAWNDENGMAKDAKVAFYDIGQTGGGLNTPWDLADIFNKGYNIGARIHSASWGSNSNAYGYSDRDVDKFMYEHDDFLILVAAGNSGDDTGTGGNNFNIPNTVGTPATAKNILSVGATQSGPTDIAPYLGANPDKGFEYLASFSSRGPTADGRTKPDVVAPGYFIKSAYARMGTTGGSDVGYMAGTSMATPVTSGSAALVRDYFMQGFYPTGTKVAANSLSPSGALVKAVIINGAMPMAGSQNDDSAGTVVSVTEYDSNQNFGRVQLNKAMPLANNNDIQMFVSDGVSLSQAQSEVFTFKIDTSSCTSDDFRMTLVWTDPNASPSCSKCVVNDLDLLVQKSSTESTNYYPNTPNNYRKSRDSVNNAERVRISVQNGETVTATVTARSIASGVKQKFAFVASGCIGEEEDEVVVGTNAPTASPTAAPTKSPTVSPTASPTPYTTPSVLTEVVVESSVVLVGCSEQSFSATDANTMQKALDRIITKVTSENDICDITVSHASGGFDFNPPVAPPTDPGDRRLSDSAITVTFKATAVVETSGLSESALFQSIQSSLDVNVKNTILKQWMNIYASSPQCTDTGDILGASYSKPTTYSTRSSSHNNKYCKNWSYTKPPTNSPTPSPTPSPTKNPTPSPTNSPTAAPTKYTAMPTKSPTASPTKNPTPSPTTPAPTAAQCTNGFRDGSETDTNCGGPDCPKCDVNESCLNTSDCRGRAVCQSYKCYLPPTPAPTSSPTLAPTPDATWRVSILSFTIVFRVDGITINGWTVSDRSVFLRVLLRLLGYGDALQMTVQSESRLLGVWPPPIPAAGGCGAGESTLIFTMTDSYGDGWNGATADFKDQTTSSSVASATLSSGYSGTKEICLVAGKCYDMVLSGGSFPSEVGWLLKKDSTTVLEDTVAPYAPFSGSFCLDAIAPTASPTSAPTVAPHVEITLDGLLELDELKDSVASREDYDALKAKILDIVKTGKLDQALRSEPEWGSDWDVKEEDFSVPDDYESDVKVYDERPGSGDDDDDNGGGFNIEKFIKDYGIMIGAGVGGLLVLVAVVMLFAKLRSGGGGGRAHKKMHGVGLTQRRSSAKPAQRRSSAKKYGGNVNFGAAASKGVGKAAKHYGGKPSYGKGVQLV